MQKTKKITTVIWLTLVLLTFITYAVGKNNLGGPTVVWFLLASILLKGQLVADYFMGLKAVRSPWRWIVTGWLLFILGMIALAFSTGN
ncbi:MAG: cytochrome C oxidase subunit IV family protein [gamma proteobacterium symbiont of Bathyaustriella thionipta]|nr:cytochrome C oxidase subunit IV family protein [gamma proteobacterium symbiont of Bathyaustriella thionipta]